MITESPYIMEVMLGLVINRQSMTVLRGIISMIYVNHIYHNGTSIEIYFVIYVPKKKPISVEVEKSCGNLGRKTTWQALIKFNDEIEEQIRRQCANATGGCLPETNISTHPKWFQMVDDIALSVSYIGTIISIVCYILIIITYCFFKALYKTPHLCTLSLAICLFVGDLAFIIANIMEKIGSNNIVACKTIAIVMHFGIVSGYSWGTTLAIDLMRTFVIYKSRVVDADFRRFKIYCAVTFSSTALIVMAAYLLDHLRIALIGCYDFLWKKKDRKSHCVINSTRERLSDSNEIDFCLRIKRRSGLNPNAK